MPSKFPNLATSDSHCIRHAASWPDSITPRPIKGQLVASRSREDMLPSSCPEADKDTQQTYRSELVLPASCGAGRSSWHFLTSGFLWFGRVGGDTERFLPHGLFWRGGSEALFPLRRTLLLRGGRRLPFRASSAVWSLFNMAATQSSAPAPSEPEAAGKSDIFLDSLPHPHPHLVFSLSPLSHPLNRFPIRSSAIQGTVASKQSKTPTSTHHDTLFRAFQAVPITRTFQGCSRIDSLPLLQSCCPQKVWDGLALPCLWLRPSPCPMHCSVRQMDYVIAQCLGS